MPLNFLRRKKTEDAAPPAAPAAAPKPSRYGVPGTEPRAEWCQAPGLAPNSDLASGVPGTGRGMERG